MGRYEQKQEKKLVNHLAVAVFIFALVIIAAIWIYVREEVGSVLNQPETKALTLNPPLETPSEQRIESMNEPPVSAAEKEIPESSETAEQPETVALPELADSDDFFRNELTMIAPGLSPWLNTDHLIRKLMMIVNDFAQGNRLQKHMRFFKLNQPFVAAEDKQGLYMAPESYRRYDSLVGAINGINVEAGLALYKKINPLLQQVFNEFSYPKNYSLDDIFKQAASEVLAAPIIEKRIALVRPSVYFKYADPELEALNPVRKQMLRMGPYNTRIIQNKVRKFVEGLVNREE